MPGLPDREPALTVFERRPAMERPSAVGYNKLRHRREPIGAHGSDARAGRCAEMKPLLKGCVGCERDWELRCRSPLR